MSIKKHTPMGGRIANYAMRGISLCRESQKVNFLKSNPDGQCFLFPSLFSRVMGLIGHCEKDPSSMYTGHVQPKPLSNKSIVHP